MRVGTPNRSETGFTIIELLVAVSLIVVVMVPITSVFWTGLKTSAASSHRTDAFAIATRESEALHALPYKLAGFYSDQAAPAWKTNTTVVLGTCSTTCTTPFAPLILPAGTTTPTPGHTGVTYTIARYIYWTDSQGVNNALTSTTFPQAYKGTTVTVTWTDPAGTHAVQQDSIIYPGGQGVYAGPGGGASTTTTSAPVAAPGTPILVVALTQPSALPPLYLNTSEIDLTITAPQLGGPVAYYTVQWSTDPLFPAPASSPQLPASSTSYAAQNLAPNTTWYFRAFAGNSAGQSAYSLPAIGVTATLPVLTTTTVPGTTTTTAVPTCLLGGFSVTTSLSGKTYLDKQGNMTENVGLSLSVNGLCSLLATVVSVLHGTVTVDPGAPYLLVGLSTGGLWSSTIAASGQAGWTVGTHDMTVLLSGSATLVTHGLLVCAWTPPGQRSSSANAC